MSEKKCDKETKFVIRNYKEGERKNECFDWEEELNS